MPLRTKFVAAFVAEAMLITLLALAIGQWRTTRGGGSPFFSFLLLGGIAVIVAVVLASLGARVIIRPLLDLSETARSLAEGDLTRRTRLSRGDEIGGLAETFNAMAGNLEKTLTRLARSQAQLTVGHRDFRLADAHRGRWGRRTAHDPR